ncbi:MAG: hypothetical protein ACYTF7_09485 [Planctomycetota bacterium]|jgi:hypothetical protein
MTTRNNSMRSLRVRYAVLTSVLLVSITSISLVAVMMSTRFARRVDVTATRQHQLSPRTLAVLEFLEGEHEILLVVDRTQVDSLIWQRIADVLEELDRASRQLLITVIDTSDPASRAQIHETFARLRVMYEDELDEHVRVIGDAAEAMRSLAPRFEELGQSLTDSASLFDPSMDQHQSLVDQGARARVVAGELALRGDNALSLLAQPIGASEIPQVDLASAEIASMLASLATDQQTLADALEQFGRALEQQEHEAAAPILDGVMRIRAIRDIASRQDDRVQRLGQLRVTTIARLLDSRSTALAISPTDATAVRFESLFPSQEVVDSFGDTNADMLFAAEELLATALQLLQEDSRFRVALMHPFPQNLLDESGLAIPDSSGLQILGMVNRLQMRGIEVLEWATSLDPDMPPSIAQARADAMPLVWVVTSIVGASSDNATRLDQMRQQLQTLLDQGESVLVCLSPSTIPSLGETDPFVPMLEELGIRPLTSTPLLREFSTASGPVVNPTMTINPIGGDHAITSAIANLTTNLPWATPMEATGQGDASIESILELPHIDDIWAESEWFPFWTMPQSQREQLRNPPTPRDPEDLTQGPWTLGLASERAHPMGEGTQRVLAIGSSGWIFDGFTQRAKQLEGRTVQISPGNLELLDASLAWLAQKDSLIAPGARVGDVARIRAMTPTQLSTIRWGVVAGLPLLVLVTGVSLRLIRG